MSPEGWGDIWGRFSVSPEFARCLFCLPVRLRTPRSPRFFASPRHCSLGLAGSGARRLLDSGAHRATLRRNHLPEPESPSQAGFTLPLRNRKIVASHREAERNGRSATTPPAVFQAASGSFSPFPSLRSSLFVPLCPRRRSTSLVGPLR